MLISSHWPSMVLSPASGIGRGADAVSGWGACEDAVDPAVKLSSVSPALESNMLSSSGQLGGSSPRGSKLDPVEGMGSLEIVARGFKDFLPCDRTGPPLAFRVILD